MRILALVAVFSIALPLAATAFREGPYPNVTGGFGEQSCHVCHLDNPINAPGGRLDIDGAPPTYAAGQTYQITIAIARDGLRRGGFEIAARFAGGGQKGKQAGFSRSMTLRNQSGVWNFSSLGNGEKNKTPEKSSGSNELSVGKLELTGGKQKGRQAGTWRPIDARVQLIPGTVDKSLTFVQHTLAGSRAPAAGMNQWTIEWEAPAVVAGPVQFNVAANAANNDDSPLGDYIYVKAVRSAPGRTASTRSSSVSPVLSRAAPARAH